ncbi:T9SS type A sorting domain-containing protein [uncultured Dokdonia sp.]|uniref:T9SS type A sorting domain-containing protein n=1 Tax=uncultured Dokdonia sp. TaxID=575653 RepID=UPI00262FF816|nr:T9SS type A sorting domain-containing protein [uncultured Dokdonia sp.]
MKKTLLSEKLNTLKATLVLVFVFTLSGAHAQENCESFDQSLRLERAIDDCGNGGRVNTFIEGGETPFDFTIRNVFTGEEASAVTSNRSLTIGVFPGTFETSIIDANGCEDTTRFTVFADNFIVRDLGCNDNGTRRIRFSNESTSFVPVQVEILGFGFSLDRGTSLSGNLPEGTYTATVSRGGCAPYDVAFGVSSCTTARTAVSERSTKQTLTIVEAEETLSEITKIEEKAGIVYPNPTTDEVTIDLGGSFNKSNTSSSVIIYNNSGVEVLKEKFNGTNTKVNLDRLKPGVYFVSILSEEGAVLYQDKLIKK